jgi:hypothetical protein
MPSCTYCGAETIFLDQGFPICLNCANKRDANPELADARKLREILAHNAEKANDTKE